MCKRFIGRNICEGKWGHNYRRLGELRDIALLTDDHIVKAIVFPIVMYSCES